MLLPARRRGPRGAAAAAGADHGAGRRGRRARLPARADRTRAALRLELGARHGAGRRCGARGARCTPACATQGLRAVCVGASACRPPAHAGRSGKLQRVRGDAPATLDPCQSRRGGGGHDAAQPDDDSPATACARLLAAARCRPCRLDRAARPVVPRRAARAPTPASPTALARALPFAVGVYGVARSEPARSATSRCAGPMRTPSAASRCCPMPASVPASWSTPQGHRRHRRRMWWPIATR